jgi:hypothetical protein
MLHLVYEILEKVDKFGNNHRIQTIPFAEILQFLRSASTDRIGRMNSNANE